MTSPDLFFERFAQKVLITDSCWLWEASRFANGYGYYMNEKAHRVAYRLFRGDIPDGKEPDHLCRVRHCVNPNHLEWVTHHVNVLRSVRNGKPISPCPHGEVKRRCKPCKALYMRNWNGRKKVAA